MLLFALCLYQPKGQADCWLLAVAGRRRLQTATTATIVLRSCYFCAILFCFVEGGGKEEDWRTGETYCRPPPPPPMNRTACRTARRLSMPVQIGRSGLAPALRPTHLLKFARSFAFLRSCVLLCVLADPSTKPIQPTSNHYPPSRYPRSPPSSPSPSPSPSPTSNLLPNARPPQGSCPALNPTTLREHSPVQYLHQRLHSQGVPGLV